MNKKPIVVITGLAVAAVAGIAGLTRDKWQVAAPQQEASAVTATAPEVPAPKVEAPAEPPKAAEAPTEAPAAEKPAGTTVADAPPAAGQPAATEVPASEPEATAEAPAVVQQPEQPKVADIPENPPPVEQQASAEVPATEKQTTAPKTEAPATDNQVAAVQPEVPAAEQQAPAAAAEAPAAENQAPAQPEVPAAEQQTVVLQPETPAPETPAPAAATPEAQEAAPAASETVPAFDTVRVEKTGEAVIAGTAKAGAEVAVKLDGQVIGTATANADGAFVVIPDAPLPSGSGALTIEATGKGDMEAVQSEQSVAVIIPAEAKDDALVAVVSPDEPTKILQKPQPEPETAVAAVETEPEAQPEAEQPAATAEVPKAAVKAPKPVSIDAVDYDSTGSIVFSGQGQAGNTARVYVDNAHIGDARIGGDGRWNFSGTASVPAGQHSLRVDGIDAAGKVHNRVEVPFFREETSKVAAAAPTGQTSDPAAANTDSEVASATGQDQEPAPGAVASAQVSETAPPPPKDGRVVIQPGNNLWRISRVLYGSGEKYTLLYKANKDQIRDPDMIFPGQIFMTPDVASKSDKIDPKRREPLKPEENAASVQ
jgi:hypothetical protein